MEKPTSVLCLDIDGTITTAEPDTLNHLLQFTNERRPKTDIFINTARPQSYCDHFWKSTREFATQEKHKCFNGNIDTNNITQSVAQSKVRNMDQIYNETKLMNPNLQKPCHILIDDMNTNIAEVKKAGYDGILVDAKTGISQETINEIKSKLKYCE
tara:strand:- start:5690 stop:6157 length:468 start_codon:yes stop_codon:yes gene_type:complete